MAFFRYRKVIVGISILIVSIASVSAESVVADTLASAEEGWWGWGFLGRFHPIIVHFPVSLLLIAAIMEVLTFRKFQSSLRTGINWLVFIGAGGAIVSAFLGWLLASSGSYGGDTFAVHQWIGIATAALGVLVAVFLWMAIRQKRTSFVKAYQALLLLATVGVSVAGHYGGALTHGQDYLLSGTPWASGDGELLAGIEGPSTPVEWQTFASLDSLDGEQEMNLNLAVRTVLAHKCFQCHSSDKMEGELRLDDKELVFKGGESGPVIVPGDVQNSELVRRITLPPGHKEAMPGKGKPLSDNEIGLIKLWIEKGAPWPDQAKGIFRVAPLAPRQPQLPSAVAGLENPLDLWINEYFKKNELPWPTVVEDRVFLRRVYFDLIGLPPGPQQLADFQADTNLDKRKLIVEELLARDRDYATHWTTFWNDLLRNDYTGPGYITNGRFNISDWLYRSLVNNKPYDQFVRELVAPTEASKGFIKGIEWRGAVNSSQTTAMQAAQNVSQALLGVNLKCASCHDSFVSDWKLDDAYAFANIFSEKPLEINRCDIPTGKMADTRILWPELGAISAKGTIQQKSEELANALTQPKNGRLYRTLVNRIWAQLMGRGIVSPTDEMDKAPWSQDLLDWMAVYFVEQGYDIKKILHLITTSKTYQLPSISVEDPATINTDKFVFTGMLKRKLTAEQFADAVSMVVHPIYSVGALKYNPQGDSIAFTNANSFVRAALVQNDPFLTALGRPSRENIISVRDNQGTLLQAMELTNGALLNETLIAGAQEWVAGHENPKLLTEAIFKQSFGRAPTEDERRIANEILNNGMDTNTVQDLLWAVILLPEFQFIE